MSKWPFTHRARALVIADPDADPALLRLAQDLLATGGTGPEGFETTGPQPHLESQLAVTLDRDDINGLVVPGITTGIEASESHPIALDPTDETRPSDEFRQELYQWGATYAPRFGHKV